MDLDRNSIRYKKIQRLKCIPGSRDLSQKRQYSSAKSCDRSYFQTAFLLFGSYGRLEDKIHIQV